MLNILNLLKKYIWLTIGAGLAFVLLAAIGSRLFVVMKRHQNEKQELNGAKARLDELYQRATFPSAANISREREKLADLTDEYNELNGLLTEDQVLPEEMEGAEFMTFFENTLRSIRDRLLAGRVAFPDKYTFGFEKYAGGSLPVPGDVPRLVQQLKITERICRILPDAAINELLTFTREEFETAVDKGRAQSGRGRALPPPPADGAESSRPAGELYSSQHFKLSFRAREGSVFDLLNRLARLPMFTVVTRVEITNPRPETSVGASGAAKPAAGENAPKTADKGQPGELSRDKRIILGREEVEVSLEIDVYNFGPPIDFKEGRRGKGTKAEGT